MKEMALLVRTKPAYNADRLRHARPQEKAMKRYSLSGEVTYTSLRARKACAELGILPKDVTRPVAGNHRGPPQRRSEGKTTASHNSLGTRVTSHLRSLRQRTRKKRKSAAATVIIGRYLSDYVKVTTSQCQLSQMTTRSDAAKKSRKNMVTTTDLEGAMKQTSGGKKRVTFNDDVTIEEFQPRLAILQVKKKEPKSTTPTVTKISDVTIKEKNGKNKLDCAPVQSETESDETIAATNDCDVIRQTGENNNDRKPANTTLESTPRVDAETPLDEDQLLSGPRPPINTKSGVSSIPNHDSSVKVTIECSSEKQRSAVKAASVSSAKMESEAPTQVDAQGNNEKEEQNQQQQDKTNLEEEVIAGQEKDDMKDPVEILPSQNSSDVYKRKNLKKRYAVLPTGLPAIREEISVRHDVVSDDVTDLGTTAVSSQAPSSEKAENVTLKLSRSDALLKAREVARLSALKGQIAAEKAAWNCVIRYPRQVVSQLLSSSSTMSSEPHHYDVNGRVNDDNRFKYRQSGETIDAFSFSSAQKLTLYQHNFGYRTRAKYLPVMLPPIPTSSVSDVSLVTGRNSDIWLPDHSVVPGGKKQKLKTKMGSVSTRK